MLEDTCRFCINFWLSLHLHAFMSSLLLVTKSFQLVWAIQHVVGVSFSVLSDLLHGERVAGFPTSCVLETFKFSSAQTKSISASYRRKESGGVPCLERNCTIKYHADFCTYSSRIYFYHLTHLLFCPPLIVETRTDALKSSKHLVESRWLQLSVS